MGDYPIPIPPPVLPDWEFGESSVVKVELTGDGLRDLALHLELVRPQGEHSFEKSRSGILTFLLVVYSRFERSSEFVLADFKWGPAAYTVVAITEAQDSFGRDDLRDGGWKAYQVALDDWRLGWKRDWLSVICRDLRFEVSD